MENKKITNIFFDLDNTLWDFNKNSNIVLQEMYSQYIEPLDSMRTGEAGFISKFKTNNHRLWEEYREGLIDKATLRFLRFNKTLEDMGIGDGKLACALEMRFVEKTSAKPYLVDNATQVLDYLYGRYTLGIVTNGFSEAQHIKLKNTNLEKYFTYVVVSDAVGVSKPDPAIFDYVINKYNLKRDETIYIGDDYNVDMVCAVNSGIRGIWLNREYEVRAGLDRCIEIKDLLEIKRIL